MTAAIVVRKDPVLQDWMHEVFDVRQYFYSSNPSIYSYDVRKVIEEWINGVVEALQEYNDLDYKLQIEDVASFLDK